MSEPHNHVSAGSGPVKNTDREIYHTPFNSVHDDSIHVTQGGGIGINVAGNVIVKPLRDWHALASINTDTVEPQAAQEWQPIATKPPWQKCEERGLYTDNGDELFYFKATHWRPLSPSASDASR